MKHKNIVRAGILYLLLFAGMIIAGHFWAGDDPLIALISWFLPGLFIAIYLIRLLVLRLWRGSGRVSNASLLIHTLALVCWFLIGFIPS